MLRYNIPSLVGPLAYVHSLPFSPLLYTEQVNRCQNPFESEDPEFNVTAPGVQQATTNDQGQTIGTRFIGTSSEATLVYQCRQNYGLYFKQSGGGLVKSDANLEVYRCDSSTGFQFNKKNLGVPQCKLLA